MKPRAFAFLFPAAATHMVSSLWARLQLDLLLRLTPLPASARILLLAADNPAHTVLQSLMPQAEIHWFPLQPDTTDIPLAAHGFEAIIVLAPLHNHPQWRTVLAESPRLLRQGGLLYIAARHTKTFTRTALRGHLAHHGFLPLSAWPTASHKLAKAVLNKLTLGVFRLSITQPEYD